MDDLKHLSGSAQQLVIVALPSENEQVLKFSSDKEPHLTLLYLGSPGYDASELALVTGFVEHAASLLKPFGLEVKERGLLGASQADVLFFNKKWTKAIDTFRGQLLKNELISKAFLSTSQFDEWNPHLTMGFPGNPAKKDDREFPGFSWVSFNRIALWTSDSEGPTFKLEYSDDMEEVPVSQADLGRAAIDDVLKHFGVKGMHWGVRGGKGTPTAHPSSEDAQRVAESKAKLKSSGTKALSTKELQELVTRLNLEQQFSNLSSKESSSKIAKGQSTVKQILSVAKTLQEVHSTLNSPIAKDIKKLLNQS